MKITVFQSDHGDCLMLTGSDGTNVLCDGGISSSYTEHVAPTLGKMAEDGEVLDLVYVSHVDQDHIGGILKMMDDAVAWRTYDYQRGRGKQWRKPPNPRPPKVSALWHNAFQDQISKNQGDISDILVTVAQQLQFSSAPESAAPFSNLIASKAEALRLADRIADNQLGIPLNPEFDGRLMYVFTPATAIPLGSMSAHIIGPFEDELDELRREWNAWVLKNKSVIDKWRKKARDDARRMGLSEAEALVNELRLGKPLGDRTEVTTPNLASLMLVVEEGSSSILLTGDGHWKTIYDGLDNAGMRDANGRAHFDVMKIAHHGSEWNTDRQFYRHITADHYVFCGNGSSDNPDPRIVQAVLDSRIGKPSQRATHSASTQSSFKLWFNSSKTVASRSKYRKHMGKLETKLKAAAKKDSRCQYRFVHAGSKFTLTI